MKRLLALSVGPYGLALDIQNVLEVGGDQESDVTAHCVWREETIPVVDLHALLGLPKPERIQQVVLRNGASDTAQVLALQVDQVPGIVELNEVQCRAVPAMEQKLSLFVASAWLHDRAGHHEMLLELKLPFAGTMEADSERPLS